MSFRPELTVEDDPKDRHKQVDGNAFWEHKSIESYNEFNTNSAKLAKANSGKCLANLKVIQIQTN